MDSYEQMHAIAAQCSHFSLIEEKSLKSEAAIKNGINCTMCEHYDNGLCHIKDEILTSMDQT